MKLHKIKSPNTILILAGVLVVVALLTYIIPAGEYNRQEKDGRELVVPGSYKTVESNPQFIDEVLTVPIRGFISAAEIIGFILLVGGAFYVFQRTGAVDAGIRSIAKAHRKSKLLQKILIPLFMVIFSLAGAVFGMSEEVIPFILIFVPLALTLGYDSVTGVAIPFIGAGVGFAGAFINPFTLGIAQGIAGLAPLSGIEYRIIVWFVLTTVAITFVSIYAHKIKKNPTKSFMFEQDQEKRAKIDLTEIDNHEGINLRHKLVLISFSASLAILVFGVLEYGWYIKEICALFLAAGILTGLAGGLKLNEIVNAFVDGGKDLISTGFVVALSKGILIVASDGRIIDTILYNLTSILENFHPIISSQMMFFVQTFINFFMPSGSGQAALTMPIMAPLSDLIGVSRQSAVLAFQFGDGFSNMIIPTSAVTMGVLSMAGIPWQKWAKWILLLELILIFTGCLLLIPPFFIGW